MTIWDNPRGRAEGWEGERHTSQRARLDLFGASIDDEEDEGALALAEAFRVNTSLKKIDLRYCIEGEVGLLALCSALQANTVLERVDMRDYVLEEHLELVREALSGREGVLLG